MQNMSQIQNKNTSVTFTNIGFSFSDFIFWCLGVESPMEGPYVEYGDPQASMGASYVMSSFNVAARYQMGLLLDTEVIEWTSARTSPMTIQSISLTEAADAVGIKFACPSCVPKVSTHSNNVGGYLWMQFRGDKDYSRHKLSGHLATRPPGHPASWPLRPWPPGHIYIYIYIY